MKVKRLKTEVNDVLEALNKISKGRMVMNWNEISSGSNPYVVMKSSNIPGKIIQGSHFCKDIIS
jgi:hypothetical protein